MSLLFENPGSGGAQSRERSERAERGGGGFPVARMESYIPQYIALIPDGNRRWARKHGLVPWKGHEKGAERFLKLQSMRLQKVFRI